MADRPAIGDRAALAGVTVLLVDDCEDTRTLFQRVLERHGATIDTASSVGEALRALARRQPTVLLCDISLGDEDGCALVRAARARLGPAMPPASALTAHTLPVDVARIREAGFQTHITKPVELAELVRRVAALARR